MVCLLFLVIQTVRVSLIHAEASKPSAWEQAAAKQESVTVNGTAADIQNKEKVTAVILRDCRISTRSGEFSEEKLLVYVRDDSDARFGRDSQDNGGKQNRLKIGNKVRVTGEAALFDEARNPGNFDQRFYYAKQDIRLLLWAEAWQLLSSDTDKVRQFLAEMRAVWKERLIRYMGEYYGGTMSAILLGEKSGLDTEMKKSWQKSGIGHILAISGLHMSFIGLGIYESLRRMGLSFGAAGSVGIVRLLLYTVMTGAGVSSQRALLMFVIRMGAEITGRDYDIATSLSLTAAILCALQPLYLLDASFLLSFGAIAGLVCLNPVFQSALTGTKESRKAEIAGGALARLYGILQEGSTASLSGKRQKGSAARSFRKFWKGSTARLAGAAAGGICASLSVNVFLLAPMLYFYFEIPPYSVFLNVIVIPLMPFFMGAGLIGSVLLFLWEGAGEEVLFLCRGILWLYDKLCDIMQMLPGSRIITGQPGKLLMALYYGLLAGSCLWFWLRRREKKNQGATAAVALLMSAAGLILVCLLSFRLRPGVEMTVLDVGQGDSIFFRGPSGKCYLTDGGSSDTSSVGAYRIQPYLLSRAVGTLEYVFVTHGDDDHINGVEEMLADQKLGVRIKTLVLPPSNVWDEKLSALARTAKENDTRVVTMHSGDTLREGEMTIVCLFPDTTYIGETGNAASLVLDISYRDLDILLTGDIEGKSEMEMAERAKQHYDILKAAHHGSKNSSRQEFLDRVNAAYTLISAGVDNRYGHPHEETIERLKTQGSKIYSTQENGAILIRSDGKTIELKGFVSGE